MAFDNPPFTVRRGDDRLIRVFVKDKSGNPVSLTTPGTKVRLTYGNSRTGRPLKVITETDMSLSGNRAVYRMMPDESRALTPFRTYWLQCRVTFPDGTPNGFADTVSTGSFSVDQTQD